MYWAAAPSKWPALSLSCWAHCEAVASMVKHHVVLHFRSLIVLFIFPSSFLPWVCSTRMKHQQFLFPKESWLSYEPSSVHTHSNFSLLQTNVTPISIWRQTSLHSKIHTLFAHLGSSFCLAIISTVSWIISLLPYWIIPIRPPTCQHFPFLKFYPLFSSSPAITTFFSDILYGKTILSKSIVPACSSSIISLTYTRSFYALCHSLNCTSMPVI